MNKSSTSPVNWYESLCKNNAWVFSIKNVCMTYPLKMFINANLIKKMVSCMYINVYRDTQLENYCPIYHLFEI